MSPKEGLMVAAAPTQTVSLTDLDPELTNFYSYLHIRPAIREFHNDQDESDQGLCVSNHSFL